MSIKWILLAFFISLSTFGQKKSVDRLLDLYNTRSVPYISAEELKMHTEVYLILDTRKKEEYDISHLPRAIWVGENPKDSKIDAILASKKPIALYCSVGIRSEDYGEKLQKFTTQKIVNLYGGIFAWKDAGFKIVDHTGNPTEKVHTFAKNWQDYLKTGIAVY